MTKRFCVAYCACAENLIESTDSLEPPPEADETTLMLIAVEPAIASSAIKASVPFAFEPFVTRYEISTTEPTASFLPTESLTK